MRNIFPPFNNMDSDGRPDNGLKAVSTCPICKSKYDPFHAKIIAQSESAHLLYFKCRRCGSSIVALVMPGPMGISTISLITDLDGSEINDFRKSKPVNSDDVLDIAHQLRSGTFIKEML